MRRRWITMLALFVATGAVVVTQIACYPVRAQLEGLDEAEKTISVSGSGTVMAEPDQVVVRLGVEAMADTASEALSQNSQQMQAVMAAVEEAGVPAEQIQTQTVQLRPRYQTPEREPTEAQPRETGRQERELIGYVATNIVEASSQDLDAIGQLLDAAVQAGANRVEGIRFEVRNPSELLGQAREAAWEDAEGKASQLADLSGVNLGDVLSIRESTSTPRPVGLGREVEMEAAVPIEPGTEEIRVDVQVTWALR